MPHPPTSKRPGGRPRGAQAAPPPRARGPAPRKPPLRLATTTLWEYPSQHYGEGMQGDQAYVGATPAFVVWNLVQRYTQPGELVVDPFCGSGTTLDVAADTGRQARGFDLVPARDDVEQADARHLPLPNQCAQLVVMDPPYGDHIHYSDHPDCIGALSAYDDAYYEAMEGAVHEAARVLKPGGHLGLYVCDAYDRKRGFVPVGFNLLGGIDERLELRDIVAVVRHNKALKQGNYHQAAAGQGFYLRGFNYLFVLQRDPKRREP